MDNTGRFIDEMALLRAVIRRGKLQAVSAIECFFGWSDSMRHEYMHGPQENWKFQLN